MKNAYNTNAYGSFAYVYDIFMEYVALDGKEMKDFRRREC